MWHIKTNTEPIILRAQSMINTLTKYMEVPSHMKYKKKTSLCETAHLLQRELLM